MAVDPADDRVYVVGSITGSSFSSMRVVALEPDGTERWARTINGFGRDADPEAITARAGRVLFGTRENSARGTAVLLDAADGTPLESWNLGDAVTDVAIGPAGELAVVGEHRGAMTVDGVGLPAASWHNVFILRFDADGVALDGVSLGNPSVSDGPPRMALADDGTLYVASAGGGLGWSHDGTSFPGPGWIARFGSGFSVDWMVPIDVRSVWDLDLGSAALVVLAEGDGRALGGVDIARKSFLAGFRETDAALRFVRTAPGYGVRELAAGDPRSYVSLSGNSVTFGSLSIASVGGDPVLASVDIGGIPRWLLRLEASTSAEVTGIAAGSGFVMVAGRYRGALDLGTAGTLDGESGNAFFAVRVDR